MIDILIPLIALVVLIVVWAKMCPPIEEPYVPQPFISWHATGMAIDISIDPERFLRVTKELQTLTDAFRSLTNATNDASQHMQHLHIHLKPLEEEPK